MYYHIIVETIEKTDETGRFRKLYRFDDINLEQIVSELILPFHRREDLNFNWKTLPGDAIRGIAVKETELPIGTLTHIRQRNTPKDSPVIWSNEMVVENDALIRDITSRIFQTMI